MLLPFTEHLVTASPCDDELIALADRHYSRQTIGGRLGSNGRKLILRDNIGEVLFVWMFPQTKFRWDGQSGYNCAMFRNESHRRSSEIILEAEAMAFEKWGPNRLYTYVDPTKVGSPNPGYCFKMAGWRYVKTIPNGKHLLEK